MLLILMVYRSCLRTEGMVLHYNGSVYIILISGLKTQGRDYSNQQGFLFCVFVFCLVVVVVFPSLQCVFMSSIGESFRVLLRHFLVEGIGEESKSHLLQC